MRRTFAQLLLISLFGGLYLWSFGHPSVFNCVETLTPNPPTTDEVFSDADTIFIGIPPDEFTAIAPNQVTALSVLKGRAQTNQYVTGEICGTPGTEVIYVTARSRTGSVPQRVSMVDLKGTTSINVRAYPIDDDAMALLNRYTDGEPREPDTGPMYWASIPLVEYATPVLVLMSLLGLGLTTRQLKNRNQEADAEDQTEPLVKA